LECNSTSITLQAYTHIEPARREGDCTEPHGAITSGTSGASVVR